MLPSPDEARPGDGLRIPNAEVRICRTKSELGIAFVSALFIWRERQPRICNRLAINFGRHTTASQWLTSLWPCGKGWLTCRCFLRETCSSTSWQKREVTGSRERRSYRTLVPANAFKTPLLTVRQFLGQWQASYCFLVVFLPTCQCYLTASTDCPSHIIIVLGECQRLSIPV